MNMDMLSSIQCYILMVYEYGHAQFNIQCYISMFRNVETRDRVNVMITINERLQCFEKKMRNA